jgi:ribosome-associated toxin RatA of RatAB toxin-antitoxin module
MIHVAKTVLLPYAAHDMYTLVLRVQDYPQFLPWCASTVVHTQTDVLQEASLSIQKGMVKEHFRTCNRLETDRSIHMELVEGPFKNLTGEWIFTALGNDGVEVSLSLRCDMKSGPLKALLEGTFRKIAETMLEAFCERAHQLYQSS